MTTTSIAWTRGDDGTPGKTWNPLRARRTDDGKVGWHCEKVSSGCTNCYSETFNHRRLPGGGTGIAYARDKREKVEHYLDGKILQDPIRWRKPRRVFVCSMTDLFGEWVTDESLDRVFDVMESVPRHTFQVLTKRPERMLAYTRVRLAKRQEYADKFKECPTPEMRDSPAARDAIVRAKNIDSRIWLGVSCEDQATADERIPILLDVPAAIRFVSAEPLLGPLDLRLKRLRARPREHDAPMDLHRRGDRISWIIAGGESGPGARPCCIDWIRDIMRQCREAEVAVFVKQLGAVVAGPKREHAPVFVAPYAYRDGVADRIRLRDSKGSDPSEWPEDLRVQEFPKVPA